MVEKIKNMDLSNLNESDSNSLLNEILELDTQNIKECINTVIDSIEYTDTDDDNIDNMSVFNKIFFGNDKVKELMEELLKEYESTTEE